MQDSMAKNIVLGFVAAAIAVLVAHQGIIYLLTQLQVIKGTPWSMVGVKPYGVPAIVNSMFWGGLWGALFAVIQDKLPGGMMWLKGLIYGWLIVIFSNWLLLPLIKGSVFGEKNQVLFAGGDVQRLMAGAIILGGFGLATGLIYGLLTKRA